MKRRRPAENGNPSGGKDARRGKLPIQEHRREILAQLQSSDVLILVADTGSGKTTQVPQIVLDGNFVASGKMVAITQPRRVAAMSVAKRVAAERGAELGGEVSYAVRFDDCTTHHTRLRYVTDGVLLREALNDGLLSRYAVVAIDEVHERSVNTDVLIGIAKRAAARRKGELKLLIMSATADALKLKGFFGSKLSTAVSRVPGRLFPVELMYTMEPISDYLDGAVTASLQLHLDEPLPGDILVFLTGQEEIDSALGLLEERMKKLRRGGMDFPTLVARPLYAALPPDEQMAAIEPLPIGQRSRSRKVMFATNVAETSITIRNVRYIIDTGVAKVRSLNLRTGADSLRVLPVSKAQARQRAGRAGREAPGKCFHLYTELDYEKMEPFPTPEILRCDLASSMLQLLAMGFDNPFRFDFIDPPPRKAVANALELLVSLTALDDEMRLTKAGREMSELPLPPMLARSVLEAKRSGCLSQVLVLASLLTVESPFLYPRAKRDEAEMSRRRFASPYGDHICLYNAFRAYLGVDAGERDRFCRDHYMNIRSMRSAESIRVQLHELLGELDAVQSTPDELEGPLLESVRKSVVAGHFRNAVRLRRDDNRYVTIGGGTDGTKRGVEVDVHPSSCLRALRKRPPVVVFHEMVLTTKTYIRTVLDVETSWVVELSNGFYRTAM